MVSLADEPVQEESRWRKRWQAFRTPILPEKARVLKERWDSLPSELRTNNQISGRHLTHCGFTLGASYCSFHCTHCYLPKNANAIPIPSLAQVKEQIDANRRFQGPAADSKSRAAMWPMRIGNPAAPMSWSTSFAMHIPSAQSRC